MPCAGVTTGGAASSRQSWNGHAPAYWRRPASTRTTRSRSHFQKTAELFHGLTAQYREVYLHLAHSAQQLVGEQPLALQADMEATERLIQSSPAAGEATEASRTGEATTERQPEPPPTARLRKEAKAPEKANEEIAGDVPQTPNMGKTGTEGTVERVMKQMTGCVRRRDAGSGTARVAMMSSHILEGSCWVSLRGTGYPCSSRRPCPGEPFS